MTTEIADGAAPGELLEALRDTCGYDAVVYPRLLQLVVLAGLDVTAS